MPRWTPRDDLAVMAAAKGRSGSRWPAVVELPDRGTITGAEARRRFWKLTQPEGVQATAPPTTAPPTLAGKRRRNTTSMEDRAAAVAADVPPTPPKLREIIADPSCSVESKAAAKVELRRHQKSVQKIVTRAEKKHASMATLLENGPDVSVLVAEFKQRGEPFTWAEFARELRTRYYPNYGAADGDFSTWTNPTHAERLCVASAAYQRAKSGD